MATVSVPNAEPVAALDGNQRRAVSRADQEGCYSGPVAVGSSEMACLVSGPRPLSSHRVGPAKALPLTGPGAIHGRLVAL